MAGSLEGSIQYHIATPLHLTGKLNLNALAFSLRAIIARHEVLRTVILSEDGTPYQHIRDGGEWQMGIVDGSIYTA